MRCRVNERPLNVPGSCFIFVIRVNRVTYLPVGSVVTGISPRDYRGGRNNIDEQREPVDQ
jgi:hypothetical protein